MDKVDKIIQAAYQASFIVQNTPNATIRKVLLTLASKLEKNSNTITKANCRDVATHDPSDPRIDRLRLNEARIKNIARAVRAIASLPCPAGHLVQERKLANGLLLQKYTVPLGVVGAVYESRPNVTFDIASLCLRSKNACVLKGSRDAQHTNNAAIKLIREALEEHGLPKASVSLLPPERESLQKVFAATGYIDVLIPRGSESLIRHVRKNSLVPVIETGAGVCHVYVETEADLSKALNIVENAKVSRPSVCNAVDTILVDKSIGKDFLQQLALRFTKHGVEVYADPKAHRFLKGYPYLKKATKENFGTEYLSLRCSVKVVEDIEEALAHIRRYSTKHSEAIVSENNKTCSRFINTVDAAVVYSNASTRFTDGEEFGLGAEIGISTQKLHARGPFALEKLVTEKWIVKGNGQIR
jgi:glutamate-5-semialdehyde dehydrogenase